MKNDNELLLPTRSEREPLSFLEKRKAKSMIRKHAMSTYDFHHYDIDVVMESNSMKSHLRIFGITMSSGPYVPLVNRIQITMLLVADAFMEDLLNRNDFNNVSKDDIAKLKFCIGVIVDICLDGWSYSGNKVLRLDLWKNYWKLFDKEGSRFIRSNDPFVPIVFSMIVKNHNSKKVLLDSDFPFYYLEKEISSIYS